MDLRSILPRSLIALLTFAGAPAALAVPVSVMPMIYYDHNFGVYLSKEEIYPAQSYTESCPGPKCPNREVAYQTQYAGATFKASGRYDETVFATDNSYTYAVSNTLQAFASVSPDLPDGWAGGTASTMHFALFVSVYEPVLFSGDALGDLSDGVELEVGTHLFDTQLKTWAVAEAGAGQTMYTTSTKSGVYHFTAVPVPSTLALFGFALIGMQLVVFGNKRSRHKRL